jgi:hypothetical protein
LPVLIVRLPQQTKGKAGLSALLRVLDKAVHLVLFNTATHSESTVCNQQCCQNAQGRHFSKLPASLQKKQRRVPPNKD